ncbi:MAG: hypothetical protein E3J35_05210 [Methanomassiliicoccales archaeon]|nr:MAG: hypothetical protein E3J35_05210 [Methanomassiliicoccales archaeon]
MEVEVGIALYSVMITVMTFLGGFVMVVGGRLLGEIAVTEGWMEAVKGAKGEREKEREVRRSRKAKGWKYIWVVLVTDLSIIVFSLCLLLVLLMGIGGDGWEVALAGGFGLFVGNVVGMVVAIGNMMYLSGEFLILNSRYRGAVDMRRR